MPHLVLEVLRITLVYRYGNSSPRYSVRTITPFLIHYLKVSQVSKYEISITLLLISVCLERESPIQAQR